MVRSLFSPAVNQPDLVGFFSTSTTFQQILPPTNFAAPSFPLPSLPNPANKWHDKQLITTVNNLQHLVHEMMRNDALARANLRAKLDETKEAAARANHEHDFVQLHRLPWDLRAV